MDLLLKESKGDIRWRVDVKSLSRAFLHAFYENNFDLMEILLSGGADINETYSSGRTPLMLAAKRSDIYRVRFLLNAKADVNVCPNVKCRRTAVSFACSKDDSDIMNLLIAAGADVNVVTKKKGKFKIPIHQR